jgi:hypothetical protein
VNDSQALAQTGQGEAYCLLGIAGVYRQLRTAPRDRATANLVLALPFFMAVWIVIAMIFVGWIPEVV